MVTSMRGALAAILVVLAFLATTASTPVAADEEDDLRRQQRGLDGQISGAKEAFKESNQEFVRSVAALRRAQRQLTTAKTTLGSTRGKLATAKARDEQMRTQLASSEAELQAASARLSKGEKELKSSETAVQQFTLESLQEGDRGLRAFGDLLRGEDPTTFSQRMSLSDSVSDAQMATMQRLAASKVILKLHRENVQQLRDEVAAARQTAAANLVRKQELESAAEDQAAEVDQLVDARSDAKSSAASARREDEEQLQEFENERSRLNTRLAALAAKELAKQRARERANEKKKNGGGVSGGNGPSSGSGGGGASDSGVFTRPVGGRITSPYGMRRHPITGVYKLHDGTDFSGACGTPVRAAASGTIIEQYYNRAYGNRVILNNGIQRGKSVVTTYNHLSRFASRPGAKVSRGQVIGYVGTTGYSTGCHLHLMVIANGRTTNPMAWL